jgi:hypothetical protein
MEETLQSLATLYTTGANPPLAAQHLVWGWFAVWEEARDCRPSENARSLNGHNTCDVLGKHTEVCVR